MGDKPAAASEADAEARLKAQLSAVCERFVTTFDGRLEELLGLAAIVLADRGSEAQDARLALLRGLHSLAGSAPILGLPALGERARALETELAAATAAGLAPPAGLLLDLKALGGLAKQKSV